MQTLAIPNAPAEELPAQLIEASKVYQPRGAAKALFPCRDVEVLIEGPAGTGKTRAALEKLNRWMVKCPGARGLILRKTRASLTQSVLVTFEQKVLPDNPELYPRIDDIQRLNRSSYLYPNGSELVVGGLDKAGRIMSTEYDLIVAFEATELTENDWESLLTRLRNGKMPFQQAIADCNPGAPTHWLNMRANKPYTVPAGLEQFVTPPRDGQRQMTRLLSRHEDNPALYEADKWTAFGAQYIDKLERLTGARKSRLRHGKWAAAEGAVYPEFDPAIHIVPSVRVPSFKIPAEWRRVRSIDFGFTHPFVCLWLAVDPDGRIYLYRELHYSKRLVEDHAKTILEHSAGERYEATVADHDAEDRGTLHRHGIHTRKAFKSVTPGIEAVAARLRPAKDGKPRLFVFADALIEPDPAMEEAKMPQSIIQEFDSYVYAPTDDGKPSKEEPLKENDDSLDALRYAVAYIDNINKTKLKARGGSVFVGGNRT